MLKVPFKIEFVVKNDQEYANLLCLTKLHTFKVLQGINRILSQIMS